MMYVHQENVYFLFQFAKGKGRQLFFTFLSFVYVFLLLEYKSFVKSQKIHLLSAKK
jgi:hypothetical protein